VSKFTDKEIRLCKMIYKKAGDILDTTWKPSNLSWEKLAKKFKDAREMQSWTLSDAIEWLKEKFEDVYIESIEGEWKIEIYDAYDKVHYPEFFKDIRGKTPLEACLKAILAILNEDK